MHRVSILLLGLAIACGTTEAPQDESLAENTATGKEDSLFQELVFGNYANIAANPGEIVSLEIIDTPVDDLPGAHYEGRYNLTELSRDGATRTTSGFFNVYRYAGQRWVRFLDEASDEYETVHAKYSWSYVGESLRVEGVDGPNSFLLDPAAPTQVTYACNYGVDDSEFLPFAATDPYHQTAAELLGELTLADASSSSDLARIAGQAATHEGVTLEEYLGTMDDESVEIYELTWFSVGYEWVRGYRGDTEVGYIFDAGFAGPVAEVGDGDFLGCNDEECSYSIPTDFANSTADLLAPALATLVDTLAAPGDFSELQEQQLRVMFVADGISTGLETLAELIDYADEGEFEYYTVGENVQWIRYYAGDTQVGGFFEADTTNLVGVVGDGEISACVPAE